MLTALQAPLFAALQPCEVILCTHMQPDMLPATSDAQCCLLTALLIDARFMAPPNRFVAPISHSAPVTLLAILDSSLL